MKRDNAAKKRITPSESRAFLSPPVFLQQMWNVIAPTPDAAAVPPQLFHHCCFQLP
jgi:hypothetical protein